MRSTIAVLAGLLLLGAGSVNALALSEVNKSLLGRVAIKGFDPVAYFTMAKAVKGAKIFSFEWKGAKWRFSSAENRDLFIASPEKYAPQYGGYCAWAVSQGSTATIDPHSWRLVDGKLYLNYDEEIQKLWEEDFANHILAADANWPKLLSE